jgi:hypothetical protein
MNQFPPAPLRPFQIFFENSPRYSQLKVCHRCQWHRWQMEKIFNQKNVNNFIWSFGSRGNIFINFFLQVHFQVSAAWYCSHYLPPVSMKPVANLRPVLLIPVAICRRCHWYRRQFATGVIDTGGNLLPVLLTPVVHLDLQISPRSSKKFEMTLMLLSGAWGKVIHEKNLTQKISWHCPFKGAQA